MSRASIDTWQRPSPLDLNKVELEIREMQSKFENSKKLITREQKDTEENVRDLFMQSQQEETVPA